MSDEFLTVAEIAALLKLNQQTVRNMIDRGEQPAVRAGSRRVRVMRSDLDAFLAERRRMTNRSPRRVEFDDALAVVAKALRSKAGREEGAAALRGLSEAARTLADEIADVESAAS